MRYWFLLLFLVLTACSLPSLPPATSTPGISTTYPSTYEPTTLRVVDVSGTGNTKTDLVVPSGYLNRVTLTHAGTKTFRVTVIRPLGPETLVDTIGPYTGIRPLIVPGPIYIEVEADGAWMIQIEALGQEPGATALSGSGDYTSGVFTSSGDTPIPYRLRHTGQQTFVVQLYCSEFGDVLLDTSGPIDTSADASFSSEACFWDIQADGDWVLEPT